EANSVNPSSSFVRPRSRRNSTKPGTWDKLESRFLQIVSNSLSDPTATRKRFMAIYMTNLSDLFPAIASLALRQREGNYIPALGDLNTKRLTRLFAGKPGRPEGK